MVARRGAHLAAERSPSEARADGARRSAAVPNGEGVASGSATSNNHIAFMPPSFADGLVLLSVLTE